MYSAHWIKASTFLQDEKQCYSINAEERKSPLNEDIPFNKLQLITPVCLQNTSDILCSSLAETLSKLVRGKPDHMKQPISICSEYSSLPVIHRRAESEALIGLQKNFI